jgi:protoporphyrinogen oxidase
MIDLFFRSFYGGIFLERDLRTSSRMFEFTFQMFSQGNATLPAHGMQEIPRQLVSRLSPACLRTHSRVSDISKNSVTVDGEAPLNCKHVVVATESTAVQGLLTDASAERPEWRAVTNVYFSAPCSPIQEKLIALNGGQGGMVNNVCVLSEIAPGYAPPGKALISVSVLGIHDLTDLPQRVRNELSVWFGPQVESWQHLRSDRIPRALPEQAAGCDAFASAGFRCVDGVFVCGDHLSHPSIEGAITSGIRTAKEILRFC